MNQEDASPKRNILGPSIPLSIMLLLYSHKRVKFAVLQRLLETTPGNLDYHLKKLVQAEYVEVSKQLFPRRPLTIITITEKGKSAFQDYVNQFQEILDQIESEE